MDTKRILKRIERRLAAVEMSADAASKEAGKPDAIRNLRRAVEEGSDRGITVRTIQALAPVLHTTSSWLLEETGPEDTEAEHKTIPVKGQVGAGGVVIASGDQNDIGRIEAPPNATSNTAAVQIIGESLGRLFDGWYAIYDDARDPPTDDLIGELCVLQLSDGRSFIKKLTKGQGKRFTLESNYEAPIVNVVVTWAAKVKTLVPR
jgi:SOS-response transcriptional repressor LexA